MGVGRGWFPVFGLETEGADRYLGGVEQTGTFDGTDEAGEDAEGDAGDVVANVFVAGEVGHGQAIGVVRLIFGFVIAEFLGAAFLQRALAGGAAAEDGGAALG